MSCELYTIGHSTKPLDDFVGLCRDAGIDLVADVRRFPVSRRNPQFTRDRLERSLPEHGIAYVWLGDTLGGFRESGYDAWMASEEFERGLGELERLAQDRTVAFMCAEGAPWKCHRRPDAPSAPPPAWSDALVARGHRVAHVLPDGELAWVQPHLELPGL
jgi:uncharacterized protein (DUF488 family)